MIALARKSHARAWLLLRRQSTSARADTEPLTMRLPTLCVWGANTGVGKTLFSAGLAVACERAKVPLLYLKPVQTGFPADSDARLVAAASLAAEEYGPHAAALLPKHVQQQGQQPAAAAVASGSAMPPAGGKPGWWLTARTLYAWGKPVSPHLAVETEGRAVGDSEILASLVSQVNSFATHIWPPGRMVSRPIKGALSLVETAGGPASPGPSGTLQCDLLRPLRLPGILVGDGRLGGISATLAALDTLHLRGYQIPFVLLMDHGLGNVQALRRHVGARTQVLAFPVCEPMPEGSQESPGQGQSLVLDSNLRGWLEECQPTFDALLDDLLAQHQQRQAKLKAAAQQAQQVLWWPFTQHGTVGGPEAVTVIDSRAGERFAVWRPQQGAAGGWRGSEMQLQYDACASWWTQGVNQQAQPRLVRALGHAAGRYGHVMYPENMHEPALELAKRLLSSVGAGWASRVFYSDNGSTAIEVAIKMALRKFMEEEGLLEEGGPELQVVGLTEGYHGDTLGAMDAVAPSPYNGRNQMPWYRPRGLFLDPPTVALIEGQWVVRLPAGMEAQQAMQQAGQRAQHEEAFATQQQVFALTRDDTPLAEQYQQYIQGQLAQHAKRNPGARLAACILEPVLQGAGGMRFIDPLFQRQLVHACRLGGMPIIFDEVFTGLWRLGAVSGASLLGVQPDIACYAKLLTGGMLPLAATLATEAVFGAFRGDSKMQALLHGHSYTAHPLGCSAALEALDLFQDPTLNPNLCLPPRQAPTSSSVSAGAACPGGGEDVLGGSPAGAAQQGEQQQQHAGVGAQHSGGSRRASSSTEGCRRAGAATNGDCKAGGCGRLLPLWSEERVGELSRLPGVQGVVALGTVLAVELTSEQGGYASEAARAVTARLRQAGIYSRPLGNVVYLMVTPMTNPTQCQALLAALEAALQQQ